MVCAGAGPGHRILNTGQYLDLPALREALARTIAEAQALRLRFRMGADEPEQWLFPGGITAQLVDLRDPPQAKAEALARMRADSDRPLDLANDSQAAFTLSILSPERHLLYKRVHHLAIDRYGMVLATNRIGEHHGALTGAGPAPKPFAPYARACEEDAAWRASDRRVAAGVWWSHAIADSPEVSGPDPVHAISGHRFICGSR